MEVTKRENDLQILSYALLITIFLPFFPFESFLKNKNKQKKSPYQKNKTKELYP